jgi:hypothetical protein
MRGQTNSAARVVIERRLSAAEGHCVLVLAESPPKAPETLASYWTSLFGSVRFARVNVESASSIPAALWALLRARLRVWFVKTRTFRSSSIYGQRVVVRGALARSARPRRPGRADRRLRPAAHRQAPPPREDGPEDPRAAT